MKLTINGDLSRYYAQNLCLIYFPGSKFAKDEVVTDDTPQVTITVEEREDGVFSAASIKVGDQFAESSAFEKYKRNFSAERIKNISAGKAVFSAGEKMFGYTPPWGILTGIRPAKVAGQLFEQNKDEAAVRRVLRNEYFLNPKKAALLTGISARQSKILGSVDKKSCSLYVSIPFCPTRCAYCSFVSFATKRLLSMVPEYLERLMRDIDGIFDLIRSNGLSLSTIYIGGGTPTTLTANELSRLLTKIEDNCDVSTLAEYTIEAGRPDTITPEKLEVIRNHGVTNSR